MAKKAKFPEQIIVQREVDGDLSYLITHEGIDEVPDEAHGETVAIYRLEGTAKFSVKTERSLTTPGVTPPANALKR
jgi:hypothetical protein